VHDFVVVGGGIVGVATARELLTRRPDADLVLLEKEPELARHQTGHNSGVIHAGIYYEPGSLKARLCRAGERATKEYCTRKGIPFEVPGKLVVATTPTEVERLGALASRAAVNGIDTEYVDGDTLRELEPAVRGLAAVLVRQTGLVDYGRITRCLADDVTAAGGKVAVGVEVDAIEEDTDGVTVRARESSWRARKVVVCGGLQADRLARLAGLRTSFRIIPFRGEYYRLPDSRAGMVKHMIYPVPDPALPFLGVHLTPTIDGGLTVGPNAVLGMSREGYRKGSFAVRDVADYAAFPGMWAVARQNVCNGLTELRDSWSRRGYLARCRRYAPDLTLSDLGEQRAGIRAQAVLRDGTLVHDFLFESTGRTLHVCNAPSPAATSALPIAAMIADRTLTAGRA
jgi:L-2-hydroxyglutarate oxidase